MCAIDRGTPVGDLSKSYATETASSSSAFADSFGVVPFGLNSHFYVNNTKTYTTSIAYTDISGKKTSQYTDTVYVKKHQLKYENDDDSDKNKTNNSKEEEEENTTMAIVEKKTMTIKKESKHQKENKLTNKQALCERKRERDR